MSAWRFVNSIVAVPAWSMTASPSLRTMRGISSKVCASEPSGPSTNTLTRSCSTGLHLRRAARPPLPLARTTSNQVLWRSTGKSIGPSVNCNLSHTGLLPATGSVERLPVKIPTRSPAYCAATRSTPKPPEFYWRRRRLQSPRGVSSVAAGRTNRLPRRRRGGDAAPEPLGGIPATEATGRPARYPCRQQHPRPPHRSRSLPSARAER